MHTTTRTSPPVLSAATLEIRTQNSVYALQITGSRSTLTCEKGTFAGQSWEAQPTIRPHVTNFVDFSLIPAWNKAVRLDLQGASDDLAGLLGGRLMFPLLNEPVGSDVLMVTNVKGVAWRY